MAGDKTNVWVDRDTALDLRSVATELARQERRRITLSEALQRLIAAWRARAGAHGQADQGGPDERA